MKSFFTFILVLIALSVSAQEGVIVKYFDSLWHPTIKKYASFYTEFKKKDTVYMCTSRYLSSNKLYCVSTYSDTNFTRGYGTIVTRFENGLAKDSTFITNNGIILFDYYYYNSGSLLKHSYPDTLNKSFTSLYYYKSGKVEDSINIKNDSNNVAYSFYENGLLKARTQWDKDLNEYIGDGFDESGKLIPNYIFIKSASFKGGINEWKKYLGKHIKSSVPAKKGAPVGRYSVYVYFTVNEKGEITNIDASNDPGYGTKEEAIRVIKNSPNWLPSIKYNIPDSEREFQTITFQVANE
jgi:antitoxin component YwqK of YwqJK toxin-antitoxin module